ncbi:MAG: CPBP family intramembrane glutamic endopeptidase [Thermoplasmatota archaeon]
MKEKSRGPGIFDWGKGSAPSIWASLLIGAILVLNSAAVILSLPYIIDGVPRSYTSSLEGTVILPYMPVDDEDVSFQGPGTVNAGDPFTLVFAFRGGRLPSIPYEAIFIGPNSTLTATLFPAVDISGGLVLATRVPGLLEEGAHDVFLNPNIPGRQYNEGWPEKSEGPADPFGSGPWEIVSVNSGIDHPVPILYENLAVSSPVSSFFPNDQLVFDASGVENGTISQYSVMTSSGEGSELVELSGDRWGLEDPAIIGKGITWLRLLLDEDGNRSLNWTYIVTRMTGLKEDDLYVSATVGQVLNGSDQLYGQEDPGRIEVEMNGDLELYQGAYYDIIFETGGPMDDMDILSSDLDDLSIHLPLAIDVGGRTYWIPLKGEGIYEGTFRAPGSAEKNDELAFHLNYPERSGPSLVTGLSILRDRSPGFVMDPDPFRLENYQEGVPTGYDVVLSAEWSDFNRKDFKGTPSVELDGVKVAPSDENDEFFEQNMTYRLYRSQVCSGGNLSIGSNTSLEFANWVSILIPTPRIFLTFPVPITGWGAVLWFFLIAASCVMSVAWLFYRSFTQLSRKTDRYGKRSPSLSFRSRDTDLAITARTFIGAMFFFYAVYWMFELFEQPTPGLDILSTETPIWIRMFLLADASVWEEISGRVILIGVPLFIYRSISGGKGAQWKQLVGGTGNFGYGEVFLILLSASLFGLAHLGWGPWKVVPTFVHGLLFGYLFVKVGLHASIAMHFLFDYSDFFFEITHTEGNTMFLLLFLSTIIFGGLFLGNWVHRCHSWVSRTFRNRPPRPLVMLVIHSLISVLLGVLLISKQGFVPLAIIFLLVPVIDAFSFLIWKRYRNPLARGAVFVSSYLSWAASPIGLAWVTDPEFDQDQGV